jgi:hypothetical protein
VVALDADAVAVGGALGWGGVAPWDELRDDASETWSVSLVDVDGAGTWSIDFEEGATWSTRVPPSTYDVYVDGEEEHALAASGVSLTTDTIEDLSVDVFPWSGGLSYDGGRPADGWQLVFADRVTGEWTAAETTGDRWSADVPAGVYDVLVLDASSAAARGWARAVSEVVVAADGTLDVELVDHSVSGTFSFDGGDPPADGWGLLFEDPVTGNGLSVGFDAAGWSTRVPAGTWDVWVYWVDYGHSNTQMTRMTEGLVIAADTTLDLALDLARVDLTFSRDGVPLTDGDEHLGLFYWLDLATGEYNVTPIEGENATLLLRTGQYAFWEQLYALHDEGTEHVAALGSCFQVESR